MILHDVRCDQCKREWSAFLEWDPYAGALTSTPCDCGGTAHRIFRQASYIPNAHPLDRTVIFEHPGTGKWSAPDRNDRPMPDRLRKEGYVKREFTSLRELERFERTHNVRNEGAHYDRGSGTERPDGIRGS